MSSAAEPFPLERVPRGAARVAARLLEAGHETWFVGGAVRDAMLERLRPESAAPQGDFDIATAAVPDEVRRLFRRTVPVGVEHGTVAVLDDEGAAHEVTTFRRDVETDGRHAVVAFGVSLTDDLARRDFTINAIAVHPLSGEVRDPFGGREDLRSGVVRAVGDASRRFLEDRLRILRALRFSAVFGFEVDGATWRALAAQSRDLAHLSRERVRDEWLKCLAARSPGGAILLWRKAGVLSELWPELAGFTTAAAGRIDAVESRDPVLLTGAALWHADVPAAAAEAAVRRLRFSNRDVARVRGLVAGLAEPPPAPGRVRDLRRWLSVWHGHAAEIISVSEPRSRRVDLVAAVHAIEVAGDPLTLRDLAVTGDDLQAAGLSAGKGMGAVLRALLDEVLDEPRRNDREWLLARARELS